MSGVHPSIIVSLISKTVPVNPFAEQPVDPLSEFAQTKLASIKKELRGLDLKDLEVCAEKFDSLSQELDEKVSKVLQSLVQEEQKARDDSFEVPAASSPAQQELKQFLSLERKLGKWLDNPQATGEKEEAAARIRSAFLEDSSHLDLSGLGLNKFPACIFRLQNLRELNLLKNSLPGEFLAEMKPLLREKGIRLVYQEHYTGTDSARHPVKASSLTDVDLKDYKSLEERRREKEAQMWDCLECKPDSYGGFRYKFSLKKEFLNTRKFLKKLEEIFPAEEIDPDNLIDQLEEGFAKESDLIDLGFEYGGEDADFFIWIPDVEALTARYAALREAQPERGLIEHLGIVRSDGIASDLDFVEALITNNGLVSDGLEFMHDMTVHILALLIGILHPEDAEQSKALFQEWNSIKDLLSEWSLPDLDLSTRESVRAAANALRIVSRDNVASLTEMDLVDRVASTIGELEKRAESLRTYVHQRHPFALGIAQSWGKLVLVKEKLAGAMKGIPLENQDKVRELIHLIETTLGAVTDVGAARLPSYRSLDRASFSEIWGKPSWIGYANRRYGEKPDQAYKTLVEDLENAWDQVEDFVRLWRSPRVLRDFVEHELEDWEKDPKVTGEKSEAVRRIRVSLEQAEAASSLAIRLDLSNLGLSQLPEGFEKLTYLKSLDLSGNQFDRIPKGTQKLPLLEELNFSGNQIEDQEEEDFFESARLKIFDISNNKYDNFYALHFQSKELRSLDFSGNGATGSFPWALHVYNSDKLKELNISGNQFTSIESGNYMPRWRAPKYLRVNLVGCPLDRDVSDFRDFRVWARANRISLKFK